MYLDLHVHLLWNIDDGSRSKAESLEMVRRLVDLGFDGAAPSPHPTPPELVQTRFSELTEALDRASLDFMLYENAENALTPETIADVIAGRGQMLAQTRYFLMELSAFTPCPALGNILAALAKARRTAIIAHPERSFHFDQNLEAAMMARDAGALLQLDLGSIVGLYGRTAERTAHMLLASGLYDVAATDMHRPDDIHWIEKALFKLERLCGTDQTGRLLQINPNRIVQGEGPV